MDNIATERSVQILRTGSFKEVQLCVGRIRDICTDDQGRRQMEEIKRASGPLGIKAKANPADPELTSAESSFFVHSIIHHKKIGEDDTKALMKMMGNDLYLARIIGGLAREQDTRYKQKEDDRHIDIILSDFLEIVPPELTANIFRVIGNPELTKVLMEDPRKYPVTWGVDLQKHAYAAFALMTPEARIKILDAANNAGAETKTMVKDFARRVAGNLNTRTGYGIQGMIEQNLPTEQQGQKMAELRGEVTSWKTRFPEPKTS